MSLWAYASRYSGQGAGYEGETIFCDAVETTGGVSLQMSKQPTPRGLPFAFKLFGLPLVFLGGLVAAFWPVSRFTNVFSAAFIVLAWLPLIGAIITFALRKIDLKTFLIVALVFGFPFLFVIAGVALFRGH